MKNADLAAYLKRTPGIVMMAAPDPCPYYIRVHKGEFIAELEACPKAVWFDAPELRPGPRYRDQQIRIDPLS